jgi:hypothetical protein
MAIIKVGEAKVTLVEPERMNLLGLMLASMIERRLTDPSALRHARALDGQVGVRAGDMEVVLEFGAGGIAIRRGAAGRPIASISGTLKSLLGAALGRDRVRSVLRGELKPRGNPLALLHVMALMKAKA